MSVFSGKMFQEKKLNCSNHFRPIKNDYYEPGVVVHALDPALGKQANLDMFEASLFYTVSSRPVKVTQFDSVSNNNNKTKPKLKIIIKSGQGHFNINVYHIHPLIHSYKGKQILNIKWTCK